MNAQTELRLPALAGGGHVVAIIPQSFEETWRVARAVLKGGLAPKSLVGKLVGDDAVSAVAVAIMSGAELGLKPMVALRSFTVIEGKPALYGDGLINVVRQSGRVAYLRTGFGRDNIKVMQAAGVLPSDEDEKDRPGSIQAALNALTPDERTCGWCSAKRSDTGEEKTVLFTVADAKRAGLWQDSPTKPGYAWKGGNKVWDEKAPNTSPWFRFPQRMAPWRAAGYCLRELFGDVLGGIQDEFEVREISEVEEMRDVTPSRPAVLRPPSPTALMAEAETIEHETVEEQTITETEATSEQSEPGEDDTGTDYGDYFERLEEALQGAADAASIEEVWTDFDPEAKFQDDKESRELADLIKRRRLTAIHPLNGM
ncbi:hypothetical protein ACHMW7_16035 [Aminobacter sp. UC22_36]|uniref:hypothetical protein n=1 Tax=Aminobacter sp. UC22_36 TaxID=3374549 RepID=UPI00375730A9